MEIGRVELNHKGEILEVTPRQSSGETNNFNHGSLIVNMLQDANSLLKDQLFRRMSINFQGLEYLVTLTEEKIIVVLRQPA